MARGCAAAFALSAVFAASHAQAQVCATPGSAGDATISGIVNTYWTPANGTFNAGSTTIALSGQRGAVATLAPGDLVLVIQMQCANINTANSLLYGDGAAGEPASGYSDPAGSCLAGRYQFVRAGTGTTNASLNLTGSPLTATYLQANATNTNGRRTFQVIRVPQYANATLGGALTAADWNGNSGGVVAIDAAYTLNLNGQSINVDGLGFRGAGGRARSVNDANQRFRWDTDDRHAVKGEGIAGTPRFVSLKRDPNSGATSTITDLGAAWGGYPTGTASTGDFARGAPGNAGGGGAFWDGASDNGGGGGGGNGGAGGRGGAGWRSAGYAGILADYSNLTDKKWGFGGTAFASISPARLILGGGGGAGDNNANSTPEESSGAAGGGIVMARAVTVTGTGTITARGARAADNALNDAAGGGGAGGSVLVVATTWTAALTVNVAGGRGGDAWVPGSAAHGGGGGGGGGVAITTAAATVTATGGTQGLTNTAQGQPGGATHGAGAGLGGVAQVVSPNTDTPGTDVGRTCKADVVITKTNTPGVNGNVDQAADTVNSGASVPYSIVATNNGPKPANNTVITDPVPTNLNCPTATCTAAGGAACPAATGAALVAALQGAGAIVPTMPSGSSVTITLNCTVP
ncbi:MAG: DUF11 domain-containing protein [Lysobacter sp.]|nr:DUF11 domain-containing protein [Lysobacter sp.]